MNLSPAYNLIPSPTGLWSGPTVLVWYMLWLFLETNKNKGLVFSSTPILLIQELLEHIKSLTPHNKPLREALILSPFHRGVN